MKTFTKYCQHCGEVKAAFNGDKCRACRFTAADSRADLLVNNFRSSRVGAPCKTKTA